MILLLPVFLLSGCWDLTEPENMSLVTVIGVGLTGDNLLEVITQDQTLSPSGQQIQKSNWTFDIHIGTGPTINEAMQKNLQTNPEKVVFFHAKAIVISEELAAQQGVRPVIDYFQRNPQIRQNTLFLVSKKGDFEKLFLPNAKLNIDTGKLIENIVRNKSKNTFLTDTTLRDFLEDYWGAYTLPYAFGAGVKENVLNGQLIEQKYDDSDIGTYDLELGDIAVFTKNKMAGWLTGEESRGFLWVKGKVVGGGFTVTDQGKPVSLKITNEKTNIKPVIIDGRMKIRIQVFVNANIDESLADMNFDDKSQVETIGKLVDGQITKEIREAIDKTKSLSADVFNFGNTFFEDYPNYWKTVEAHWPDLFAKLDVDIQVATNIQHVGFTKKSPVTESGS